MREIKFRVWNGRKKEYEKDSFYSGLVLLFNGEVRQNEYGDLIGLPADKHIIEQYTGLKDKKGVEIYEGDIIQHYAFEKGNTSSIEFDSNEGWLGHGCPSEWRDCEVIGNIHE